jgi:hypothetical protein
LLLIVRLKWACREFPGFGRTLKTALSVMLALQMLALLALASCPALHHALHHDSDSPDHHCLVTAFAKGLLSGPEMTPVLVLIPVFVVCAVLRPSLPLQLLFKYRFAPSRAPPRF